MKWFYNLKISTKLIISFLLVAIIAGVVGFVGLMNISRINEADTLMYENNTMGINYSANAARFYQRMKYNIAESIILKDDSKRDKYATDISSFIDTIDEQLANYESTSISDETDREILNRLKSSWAQYRNHMVNIVNYIRAGQYEAAENELLGEADAIGDEVRDLLVDLVDINQRSAEERAESNTELARSATSIMIILILISVAMAIFLGFFISRIISNPVKKIVTAANQLAIGDMDITFDTEHRDETGQLIKAFKNLVTSTREQAILVERIADGDLTVDVPIRSDKDLLGRKLSEMVKKINGLLLNISNAAEQVSAGSKQISDSSMALSQGATEQASSIEELTASIEQVSSQTKINAENASKANEMAEQAKNYAITGNEQMKEMLKAMDDINESSSNINKIIKVIDDIAFQTNILALNAAVEAARAGQHGKGFAVVAEEVRTLAGRSANAAKETTALIEDSIKKSEEGTRIARETAEALEKIVDSVESVSKLVSDINNASNEQAVAISQINQGVMQVSQVVQENSATSEESAAASEELSGQADLLYELISRFRLREDTVSRDKYGEMSPEVAKMLDNMTTKTKSGNALQEKGKQRTDVPKSAISLNDMDFGKY